MKPIKTTIAALAIACSSVFSLAGHAQAGSTVGGTVPNQGEAVPIDPANYVIRNCAFCHGDAEVQGRAVAPRLAGQHQEYVVIQLHRFRDETRDNPFSIRYMSHAARQLLPENDHAIAAYLSSLEPKPAANGKEELVAQGEAIFKGGVPSDNIPACQFCHGPDAQGVGRFPRLGGQSYFYMKRRLEQWGEGFSEIAQPMAGIAKKLSPEQIDAVASYLSYVGSSSWSEAAK